MPLTNTQLRYYDSTVLRLPANKRTEYHKQVDGLIGELSRRIRDRTEITITKVVKAGSVRKAYFIWRTCITTPANRLCLSTSPYRGRALVLVNYSPRACPAARSSEQLSTVHTRG